MWLSWKYNILLGKVVWVRFNIYPMGNFSYRLMMSMLVGSSQDSFDNMLKIDKAEQYTSTNNKYSV